MKRWLLNILIFLSLTVCIGTALLWIRSYFAEDNWQCTHRDRLHYVNSFNDPMDFDYRYTQQFIAVSCRGTIQFNLNRQAWEDVFPHHKIPPGDWHWEHVWMRTTDTLGFQWDSHRRYGMASASGLNLGS